MSMQVGKVRFVDGTVFYVVVDGSSGYATTRLFASASDASASRNDGDEVLFLKIPDQISDNENVDVWTWEGSTDPSPSFNSTASRSLMLLTGTRSIESSGADYMREQMDWGFGSR